VNRHESEALLSRVPLFAGLDADALGEVMREARRRTAAAGDAFFAEGDPATSFFVVDSGSVKLTQLSPEGHLVVLRLIGAGESFGGVAPIGGES
jgi:CRP-like cAMP-binding protein